MIIKPDLSDASLHVISIAESSPLSFDPYTSFQSYRLCEDTLVSFWNNSENLKCGIFSGFTSAQFSRDVGVRHWLARDCHYLCPASGRFVYFGNGDHDDDDGDDGRLFVLNLT